MIIFIRAIVLFKFIDSFKLADLNKMRYDIKNDMPKINMYNQDIITLQKLSFINETTFDVLTKYQYKTVRQIKKMKHEVKIAQ